MELGFKPGAAEWEARMLPLCSEPPNPCVLPLEPKTLLPPFTFFQSSPGNCSVDEKNFMGSTSSVTSSTGALSAAGNSSSQFASSLSMLRVDYSFIDVEYRYGLSQVPILMSSRIWSSPHRQESSVGRWFGDSAIWRLLIYAKPMVANSTSILRK